MQGFNMGRYVPPDQEGILSGNQVSKKHALGSRARHLHTTGALTVRFEMPFAIWCGTCTPETLIGQGVRFNAEKKKVGSYYSTPVYSFRMRHPACGGWIEIRTDPANTAYVVAGGGRKRESSGEVVRGEVGEIVLRLPGEEVSGGGGANGKEGDPFARLEGKVEDKKVVDEGRSRILELQARQDRGWDDPYEMSRRLRRTFRVERKGLEKDEMKREALKDKMSLGIEIVDESEEDRLRAGLVDFGPVGDTASVVRTRPLFEAPGRKDAGGKDGKRVRTAELVARRKESFRSELTGNTRAVVDPFLSQDGSVWQPEAKRRKKTDVKTEQRGADNAPLATPKDSTSRTEPSTALVSYASDSD
ncbi:CWC16 protein [Aspergillus avenaceus]|uniref:CWC16 protein n=1 Tax=Aspergillus avenaceus TaxID=36643 RepID=A0A5N6TLU4_ASPAV|nr:CWC16 protein [Aspergillus avenaceus]